jgi:hypothetical protein
MAGPLLALGSLWPPLAIHSCSLLSCGLNCVKHGIPFGQFILGSAQPQPLYALWVAIPGPAQPQPLYALRAAMPRHPQGVFTTSQTLGTQNVKK